MDLEWRAALCLRTDDNGISREYARVADGRDPSTGRGGMPCESADSEP